jgi:hypothetical protein
VGIAGTAGYGYTESVGPIAGAHHRTAGSLGVGYTPLPWLSLSLRVDGRLDIHPPDPEGADGTMVGDPRLSARMGHAIRSDLTLGGSLGLWFPGAEAPSFKLGATSIDLKALAAWRPKGKGPWTVVGNVGFRLDNSASSAPDLRRVRPGDRLSLGLSDSHAVLAAVGVAYQIGLLAEVFLDVSADILVGEKAPTFTDSPLRVSLGGRYFLKHSLQLELSVTGSLSSRPSLAVNAPLVPVEPRVLTMAGLRFGIPRAEPASQRSEELVGPEDAQPEPTQVVAKAATVTGAITDEKDNPLPEASVVLVAGETRREAFTDARGTYQFPETPLGPAHLEASAAGFVTQSWDVEVTADMGPLPSRALAEKANTGTLRVLTRTFGSEPLRAQIVVNDHRNREVTKGESDEQGRYEIELSPGEYRVIIRASGYRQHRRKVTVERNGVAILNVDMREN